MTKLPIQVDFVHKGGYKMSGTLVNISHKDPYAPESSWQRLKISLSEESIQMIAKSKTSSLTEE